MMIGVPWNSPSFSKSLSYWEIRFNTILSISVYKETLSQGRVECAWIHVHCYWITIIYVICTSVPTAVCRSPDRKVHGANMGPTMVLSAPGGPHVGPMNLAIRDDISTPFAFCFVSCGRIWIDLCNESIMNGDVTDAKYNATNLCAYFIRYNVLSLWSRPVPHPCWWKLYMSTHRSQWDNEASTAVGPINWKKYQTKLPN